MKRRGVIYRYKKPSTFGRAAGLGLLALALGGMVGPVLAPARLEAGHMIQQVHAAVSQWQNPPQPLPKSVPVIFNPLVTPDGASIAPVNTEFSLIIPNIGVNAEVIPAVNPADPKDYLAALDTGIAHASTSFFPDEDGTVYLFSHSTNYDWFVRDLNAVFYLLKNLETDDLIVLFYKGRQYTYRLTDKKIVSPSDVSYLVPQSGAKRLILQTCWPPGSTSERLLIFADLVDSL